MSRFVEIVFRILHVPPDEATRLGRDFAANPSWFFGLNRASHRVLEETTVRTSRALMMGDAEAGITLLWAAPDRVFVLSGTLTRVRALEIANSLGPQAPGPVLSPP